MSKRRGRPKATVKRSKPTSFLVSSNSYDDEEISFIQNQPNYHCEIAETFIASSQRQFDEPVESIAKEYGVEDAECSISQEHSISSCSVENTPSNIEAEDSGVALTDDLCCADFQNEQDDDNQSGNDMFFCHDEERVNELTDSTLYLEMVKDLSTGKGTDDVSESKDKWYEEVVADMQEYFSEELSNMEEDLLRQESDFGSLITGPQDTELLDFSGFESNSDQVYEQQQADQDQLIYSGATITVGVSMLLIITFCTRYHLSGEAMANLLTLISVHCAEVHPGLQSLHNFMKYFHHLKNPIICHKYCSHCLLLLNDGHEHRVCPNDLCQQDLTKHGSTSFFIEVPVAKQIQSLFAKDGFFDDLQYRFRRTQHAGQISDIYDGHIYKSLFENNGLLSDPKNISLTWNTDGVPLFKSSSFALWPLYFIVNELPYNKRIRRENMIFAGLWFGTNKPQMLTFFSPFYEGLSKLETEGVNITIPGETACSFNSKAIVICGTCDLPAKCMVCNTVQYNGFYGCCKCKTPGRTVKTSARGHMHAFPFNADNIKGEKRTSAGCMEDAKQAIDCGKPVNGIKGPCWLAALKYYDIIEGTAIDYMHCVLLGIVKMLLRLWFSKEHSSALFNISNRVKEVDQRLVEIKYPNEISRCPRALEFHLKYYKASELRSFLLFCGLPVLHGILPDEYFQHFALLSESVFILLLDSISEEQLVHAERMLFHFCLMMGPLYGERYEPANVHYLVHLVDNVRALGPLWTHSCFHFEDKNGFLLKLVHGTQNVQFQLVTAVSIIQKLPSLENDIEKSTEKAYKLYQAMQRYNSGTNETLLDRGIYAIGSLKYYNMAARV